MKSDLMMAILFNNECNERLQSYTFLSIPHVLIIFIFNQSAHYFPNEFKSLPNNFSKCFWCNGKNEKT